MKNKVNFLFAVILVSLFSCKNEEQKKVVAEPKPAKEFELAEDKSKMDSLVMDNGIKIHWIHRGEGDKIVLADCINIDYKVFLTDGKLIEGNHLLNKPSFPFIVGFQMQTEGWDIAMEQLKIGDEVEIFIPSKLARGEKGVEGIIPPNADNIVYMKAIDKRRPTREIDGNKVYVFEENQKNKVKFNRENTIVFHSMTSTPSNPMYFNSFRTNQPFTMKMKDAGIVPGLKKALNNAKKADRMYVVVPPEEAYGAHGYLDIVKSNEPLLFNIFVMDVF
ncbi:MAG: FKBP-type peptidyl-prolyl cis-trans isomerase [Crocinitomicaceae bacterium]